MISSVQDYCHSLQKELLSDSSLVSSSQGRSKTFFQGLRGCDAALHKLFWYDCYYFKRHCISLNKLPKTDGLFVARQQLQEGRADCRLVICAEYQSHFRQTKCIVARALRWYTEDYISVDITVLIYHNHPYDCLFFSELFCPGCETSTHRHRFKQLHVLAGLWGHLCLWVSGRKRLPELLLLLRGV